MSRKIILSLATAATVAVASLASQSADARSFGGGGRGFGGGARIGVAARVSGGSGGRLIPILNPGHPRHPGLPGRPHRPGLPGYWAFHHHDHGHLVFRGGRWIVLDTVVDTPVMVPAAVPGPCTCLTKSYTPSGLVVFADICTRESASAPVDTTTGDASQAPTTPVAANAVPMSVVPTTPNYAGRTYEDYLAANPQAANPQASQAQQKN